jgi:predicted nucleotidyltransferase
VIDGTTAWQEATVRELGDVLVHDPEVEALAVVGSGARSGLDAWSDLDVLIVVRPEAFARFFPGLGWLERLGRLYAYEQHREETRGVSRVCFEDLRRLDAIVTTGEALSRSGNWAGLLAGGARVIFARGPEIERVLGGAYAAPRPAVSDEAFAALVNGFWFKAVVAVQKVVRGDLLVALHLSLELVQECCVLAMMLRDREAGTTKHRDGVGDDLVTELEEIVRPFRAAGILDSIEQSAVAFDGLAGRWAEGYREKRGPLLAWVAAARRALAGRKWRDL